MGDEDEEEGKTAMPMEDKIKKSKPELHGMTSTWQSERLHPRLTCIHNCIYSWSELDALFYGPVLEIHVFSQTLVWCRGEIEREFQSGIALLAPEMLQGNSNDGKCSIFEELVV